MNKDLLLKINKFHKKASGNDFSKIIDQYESPIELIDAFIEGLNISTLNGYDNGRGFDEKSYNILLKENDLIAKALENIKPELQKLYEELISI